MATRGKKRQKYVSTKYIITSIFQILFMSAFIPFKIPNDKIKEFRNDCSRVMYNIESVHKFKTNHSPHDATLHYKFVVMYGRKPLAS